MDINEILENSGIEVEDQIVVLLRSGHTIEGTLVTVVDDDDLMRVVTTGFEDVPKGTLLTILEDEIISIGHPTENG
ncbi:hypothetical protein [Gracilibacillus sp. YIM 98692]|uniref:hypothetical protein n=1 Tax=Gracilibacillus sp. YIM 98692 TaxID=2663532 RepID=UPI0013D78EC5|nr:hypothetical protein [Gracilibacillus sp. YIM 98692]